MTRLNLKDIKTGRVRTHGGLEVRIYATDGGGGFPIHGATKREDGWEVDTWTREGRIIGSNNDHPHDLVLIPQAQYFNVYTNIDGALDTGRMCEEIDDSVQLGSMTIEMEDGQIFETFQYLNGEITKER
jgi:hypothetical protein